MHILHLKNWLHFTHRPSKGSVSLKLHEMIHDRTFWAIVVTVFILALFMMIVAYSIWALPEGEPLKYERPIGPWYPYFR
jgi:hypothetical protein